MSGLLTKQYFETMDIIYKEANYDMLNLAKLVYQGPRPLLHHRTALGGLAAAPGRIRHPQPPHPHQGGRRRGFASMTF